MMMNHLGYARIEGIDRFENAQHRALIKRLWDRLTNRPRTLLPFGPIHRKLFSPNGVNRGVREIPVRRIVGSLARVSDFDRNFRPLYQNQRQRWANIWALHSQKGWEPILVHQIGGLYFVEDGHHRTSVAHDLGLDTIEAIVIAYPVSVSLNPNDSLEKILAILETNENATGNIQPGPEPVEQSGVSSFLLSTVC
jgi:hypothetical protein